MTEINVLIVEDEVVLAMGIEKSLKSFGYKVAGKVTRGENAVMMALDKKPDIILMDIHLEGRMDGIEAAEEIHKKSDVPIVFLTAYSDEETFKSAIKTNPYGYLGKPFRPDDIRTTIETAINRYRAEKAENALEISEKNYELLFNTMTNGFALYECITDNKGKVTDLRLLDANPVFEKITGYKAEENIGKTILEVIPDFPADLIEMAGRVAFEDKRYNTDRLLKSLNIYLRLNLFSPEYGKVATFFSDITEYMKIKTREEETLIQIERNLEQLAILNDEIRNPLQVITGYALIDNCEHTPQILEQAEAIDKLVNLIDQRWLESAKIRDFLRKHYGYNSSSRDEKSQ